MGLDVRGKNRILDALCGVSGAASLCALCYIGLLNSEGVEPSAETGYVRQLLGMSSQSSTQRMSAASEGTITNSQPITYPVALANWDVTVTQFALYDSATATVPMFTGNLTASVNVLKDYVATFVPNSLTISVV